MYREEQEKVKYRKAKKYISSSSFWKRNTGGSEDKLGHLVSNVPVLTTSPKTFTNIKNKKCLIARIFISFILSGTNTTCCTIGTIVFVDMNVTFHAKSIYTYLYDLSWDPTSRAKLNQAKRKMNISRYYDIVEIQHE
jgi:hypothetical protein